MEWNIKPTFYNMDWKNPLSKKNINKKELNKTKLKNNKKIENFVAGKLFNVNDDVVTLDGVEGTINKLGSNHVEVRLKESDRFKNFWLSDVCLNN